MSGTSPRTGVPRVLSIAGTDPTGGAGLQGDLKSIAAHHGYGMGVVTALVAQNTRGVRAVHVPPAAFLREQLDAVSDDVEVDAVKIGMLGSAAVVEVVADWLRRVRPPVVVLDPVMVASSGDRLLDREAEAAVRDLARLADLVTPNVPELAVLAGLSPDRAPDSWEAVLDTAGALSLRLGTPVLAKGGHLDDETARDALVVEGRVAHLVSTPMLDTTATHGTGCAMSSALATLRATGLPWEDCLDRAKAWLTESLRHGEALRVGHGRGPVDHLVHLRP